MEVAWSQQEVHVQRHGSAEAAGDEIMADARQEASMRKLRLSGNWGLALCVYLVWLVQVVVGVRLISRHVAAPFLLAH
ncbi:hypothetical protein HaLaN_04827, partial [Haematococcus lacustris]